MFGFKGSCVGKHRINQREINAFFQFAPLSRKILMQATGKTFTELYFMIR